MKPIFRTSSRFLAVASAALAMTFGAAYAAGDGMPAVSANAHGEPGGSHGGGAFMMRRLEALHAQLHLKPEQEQKWQSALAAMKENRQAMHANHQQMRQQLKAAQQQSILDLDALHAAHQQFEQRNQQLREQTETTWLAFYDSLDSSQKATVSTAIKKRFAKMEARREKMHDQWEKRHGAAPNGASSNS
jgi:Spy/CpxP family protein refolding chaperone